MSPDPQSSSGPNPAWGSGDEMLRQVVESCPSGLVLVDGQGRIVLVNEETERLFGYQRSEIIGQRVEILLPSNFRGTHTRHRDDYIASPSTRAMGAGRDLYGRRKDGGEFPVEVGLNPIHTENGVFVLGVIVDITERKLAEQKFELAVESCPSGMVMVDSGGSILLVNAETERLFGYSRSELVGKSVEILVPRRFQHAHPEHRQKFVSEPSKRAMGAGRDLYGLRKDGSEFPVEIGLTPVPTPEGTLTLSVIVDISERRRAEAKLAEHARELARSNADLEQFAYIASHDLQEPLRMVSSYTQLLADRYEGKLDDRADRYIQYAVEGAQRMQQLIKDLLAFSRVGTHGKMPETVDLSRIANDVVSDYRRLLRETNGTIDVSELPIVEADPVQMGQLFQNLIGNALKFRRDEPPHIRIAAEQAGDGWCLSVSDNGIGIDEKYWGRIFDAFQRLHERGTFEGNGIGLAISKKIVERHGGEIWLESRENFGTTFYITLPATQKVEVL